MDDDNSLKSKTIDKPYEYQSQLVEMCKDQNLIVCLQTGTGKTYIAVMLIKLLSDSINKPFEEGGKRTIFLVNTVPLVEQQARVLRSNTDFDVGEYHGERFSNNKHIDTWDKYMWLEEFKKNQILVLSAQIFVTILEHCFINLDQINLIIFDEVHHASGMHPYNQIMRLYKEKIINIDSKDVPRILGLSASIVNNKCKSKEKFHNSLDALEVNCCSRVVTKSIKYDTDEGTCLLNKPKLKVELYKEKSKCEIFVKSFKEIIEKFTTIENTYARIKENEEDDIFTKKKNPLKELKRLFSDLLAIYEELGYYAFSLAFSEKQIEIKTLANNIVKLENSMTYNFLDSSNNSKPDNSGFDIKSFINEIVQYITDLCSKVFNRTYKEIANSEIINYLSARLRTLLDILKERDETRNSFHGIIFVERKETACQLNSFLKRISLSLDDYSFVKSEYIVGNSASQMGIKEQAVILKNFHERKINILIGTNVIEEGVDVRACNVVIRFNPPKTFGSFIQSKGRARAANSTYYIIAEETEYYETLKDDISNFLDIEEWIETEMNSRLKKDKINSEIDLTEEDDDIILQSIIEKNQDKLKPYRRDSNPDSPQISCYSAISVVQKFCSTLENRISLYARWKIVDKSSKICSAFQCILTLPPSSMIHEDIISEELPSKRLAKMSAALKLCKILDEKGQLDEFLVPLSRQDWCKKHLEDELKENNGSKTTLKSKPGRTNNRREYARTIAEEFHKNNPQINEFAYLNVFEFQNENNNSYSNFVGSDTHFGFITSNRFENVPEFNLQTIQQIDILVRVKEVSRVKFDKRQLDLLKKHHELSFKKLLNFNYDFDFENGKNGGLLVLLNKTDNKYQIDWNSIEKLTASLEQNFSAFDLYNELKDDTLHLQNVPNYITIFREQYETTDKIICSRDRFHKLTKICLDMKPKTSHPSEKYEDFAVYHKIRNNLDTTIDEQPLVELTPIVTDVDFIKYSLKHRILRVHSQHHFISEHVRVYKLDYDSYCKLKLIPSVLHRIDCLLKAKRLKNSIESYIKNGQVDSDENLGGWKTSIKFHKFIKNNDLNNTLKIDDNESSEDEFMSVDSDASSADEYSSNSENEEYETADEDIRANNYITPKLSIVEKTSIDFHLLPNVYEILQCLTIKNAKDTFDLERYELLGDCFLKLNASLYIYCKFSEEANEGNLSALKAHRISNKYLYKLAIQKELEKYIVSDCFEPTNKLNLTWIPLNSIVSDPENAEKIYKKTISDKSLADCIEALIGVYLVKCGTYAARKFMNWLEFVISIKLGVVDFNEKFSLPNPIILSKNINTSIIEIDLKRKYSKFEKKIQYQFNNIFYLLQAFTHPSYMNNTYTGAYESLEFIGDAVLDILVTQYLFNECKDSSPGQLTDMRQALVNNNFFAYLAVKHDFDKYIQYSNRHMFNEINTYKQYHKKYSTKNAYFNSNEEFDIDDEEEELESPKYLADIFESVAGAIYLDSGCSLDAVWKVYYKMLAPYFKMFIENTPKSPIRAIYDLKPNLKFTDRKLESDELDDQDCYEVTLHADELMFIAKSKTKRQARIKACKIAVKCFDPQGKILYF